MCGVARSGALHGARGGWRRGANRRRAKAIGYFDRRMNRWHPGRLRERWPGCPGAQAFRRTCKLGAPVSSARCKEATSLSRV